MSRPGDFSDEFAQFMGEVLDSVSDVGALLTRPSLSAPQVQTFDLRVDEQDEHDAFIRGLSGGHSSPPSHESADSADSAYTTTDEHEPNDRTVQPQQSGTASSSNHPPHDSGSLIKHRPRPVYGVRSSGRPPFNVRLPQNVDISMVELATWFPASFMVPTPILRAVRNGFTREELAEMQLRAVNGLDDKSMTTAVNRIQQQISKAGKLEDPGAPDRWNTEAYVRRAGLQHDLTANAWKQKCEYDDKDAEWTDMKLVEIARAVPTQNWPTGKDRLLVTACLEYAVARPWLELDTTQWAVIIQNHFRDLVLPPAPTAPNTNRDTEAHDRLFR
ncbi:hypothetical protein LTR82_005463 [Friedmanniomyces endolithicus]|uniref:Uncharacterized protein n=1 Tax=Friedmanniomyces endolithicus TaxID=329885 RepID=A0AAN6JB95_9PEZI|nr:hypothetical protein LTR82_005463 [Friedmanniomyces endolithicus]